MLKRGKRGEILIGTIVFIILNFIYLSLLIIFISRYSGGTSVLEETYAKQIALIVDSAQPGTFVFLDMKTGFDESRDRNFPLESIVSIEGNEVRVKLNEQSPGQVYRFFNDISVNEPILRDTGSEQGFLFGFGGYNE